MEAQTIVTPAGERLVVISEADYLRLVDAAETAADLADHKELRRRIADGEEELVPAEVVDRILDGENRIRVWREHRGLTLKALAEKAAIAQSFLSQIETGKREGTIDTLREIANALRLTIDDLVG